MSKDQRTGWLAQLKPGDQVAVYDRVRSRYALGHVTRITPSGQLVCTTKALNEVSVERRYTAQGEEYGVGRWALFLVEHKDVVAHYRTERRWVRVAEMFAAGRVSDPHQLSDEDLDPFLKKVGPAYGPYRDAQTALRYAIQEFLKNKDQPKEVKNG